MNTEPKKQGAIVCNSFLMSVFMGSGLIAARCPGMTTVKVRSGVPTDQKIDNLSPHACT